MAYRIRHKDQSVGDAIRRIAGEQLAEATDAAQADHLSAEDVHEIRLHCKKLRALIRLVRPCFDQFDNEDALVRDVAKLLAPLRNRQVQRRLLAALLDNLGNTLSKTDMRLLTSRIEDAEADLVDPELSLQCRRQLRQARDRVATWKLSADGWEAINDGLQRTYTSARQNLNLILDEPCSENFHALRRQAKYHLYHASLLIRIDPKRLKKRIGKLNRLCDDLGDAHDLAILRDNLCARWLDLERSDPAEELLEQIECQVRSLEQQSTHLAQELFSQLPKTMVAQWGKHWSQWR